MSVIGVDEPVVPHRSGRSALVSPLRLFQCIDSTESETRARVEHLYFVDLLRLLGAVCILVWHYYHFNWHVGDEIYRVSRDGSPFLDELFLFYSRGLWAVQLFWIISGVIFGHVYAQTVISGRAFFINRIARLYPLHIVTLVAISLAQVASFHLLGYFQVVQDNSLANFVRNLWFAGDGFNEPVWSVSAEIGVYVLFFLVMRFVFRHGIVVPLAICLGTFGLNALSIRSVWFFSTLCAGYFFWGLVLYLLLLKARRRFVLAALASFVCWIIYQQLLASASTNDIPNLTEIVYFTPIILWAGALDFAFVDQAAGFRRVLRSLGDLTYSTYLWHFPVQVVVLTAICAFGWDRSVFNEPLMFVVWIVGMLAIAALSFRFIEAPARAMIRRAWAAEVHQRDPSDDGEIARSNAHASPG